MNTEQGKDISLSVFSLGFHFKNQAKFVPFPPFTIYIHQLLIRGLLCKVHLLITLG